MKIALLAPPYLPVPPLKYGGTEKIVSLLADGLTEKGHDVTLFASGDSKTKAKLRSIFPKHLGNSGYMKDNALLPLLHYKACFDHQEEFDIIHNHAQYLPLFLTEYAKVPVVHTWHGSYYPDEGPIERRQTLEVFRNQHFISISKNQQAALPDLNYAGVVYNGVEMDNYPFKESNSGEYVLWIGRITEKKGPLASILAAKEAGVKIKLSAAIDPIEEAYFEKEIKPHVDNDRVILLGELSRSGIVELYQNALCTLYPITWHEPFGLVMVESMACGTPVIAYDNGSVSEIVKDGGTGFIVKGVQGLVDGIKKAHSLDRSQCRKEVESSFTVDKMVEGYLKIYKELI